LSGILKQINQRTIYWCCCRRSSLRRNEGVDLYLEEPWHYVLFREGILKQFEFHFWIMKLLS